MWTFLALVVPTLLFLPTVLLLVLFSGRTRGAPPGPGRSRHRAASTGRHDQAEPANRLPGSPVTDRRGSGPPAADETCDRCRTAAVAAVYLTSGRLLLCGHHGRQHREALQAQGAVVVGELRFASRPTAPSR